MSIHGLAPPQELNLIQRVMSPLCYLYTQRLSYKKNFTPAVPPILEVNYTAIILFNVVRQRFNSDFGISRLDDLVTGIRLQGQDRRHIIPNVNNFGKESMQVSRRQVSITQMMGKESQRQSKNNFAYDSSFNKTNGMV